MHNADRVHAVAALTSVQSDNQSLFQEIIKREIITIQSFLKGAGPGGRGSCVECLLTKHWERRHSSQNDQHFGP